MRPRRFGANALVRASRAGTLEGRFRPRLLPTRSSRFFSAAESSREADVFCISEQGKPITGTAATDLGTVAT
jgi:hypothetical protein